MFMLGPRSMNEVTRLAITLDSYVAFTYAVNDYPPGS